MSARSDGAPDEDDVFDLLSNHRRRYTVHFCKQEEGPVTLSDLSEQVAAWEQDKAVDEIDWDERKRVYTSLQQTHLPTLADAGMIHYEDGEVELTEDAELLEVYLDVVPGESIPWAMYYLGLSGIGILVLGGVWLGVFPTDPVPAIGWAALVVLMFAASAAVHAYQSRKYRLGESEDPI